ncbi:hypothetical protein NQ317_014519 [Molorchus minor]|uniref:Uncharacterized protein n=1 Tax=Molorchus minor TaxID=1323400 RepID=A0ABQ9JAK5_9CUCU|nr:hypothetical protein NQ317_014519 [Molorchus minor]
MKSIENKYALLLSIWSGNIYILCYYQHQRIKIPSDGNRAKVLMLCGDKMLRSSCPLIVVKESAVLPASFNKQLSCGI